MNKPILFVANRVGGYELTAKAIEFVACLSEGEQLLVSVLIRQKEWPVIQDMAEEKGFPRRVARRLRVNR